jgi:hypothetical protein
MNQPPRDASGKFMKRAQPSEGVVGVSHGEVYFEVNVPETPEFADYYARSLDVGTRHDQPIEYEDAPPRVPTWAWMLGLAALIIAAAGYGAVQLAQG